MVMTCARAVFFSRSSGCCWDRGWTVCCCCMLFCRGPVDTTWPCMPSVPTCCAEFPAGIWTELRFTSSAPFCKNIWNQQRSMWGGGGVQVGPGFLLHSSATSSPAGSGHPGLSGAPPGSDAVHPAAAECWPRSSAFSAPAVLLYFAWPLAGCRTAPLTVTQGKASFNQDQSRKHCTFFYISNFWSFFWFWVQTPSKKMMKPWLVLSCSG